MILNLLLIFISVIYGFTLGILYMHYKEYNRIEHMLDVIGRDYYPDYPCAIKTREPKEEAIK